MHSIFKLFLPIAVIFSSSCRLENDKTNIATSKTTADSLSEFLTLKVGKFFIPNRVTIPDSNELYFYYAQRFDTSLLVHLRIEKGKVRGVVYQVALPYNTNREGLEDEDEDDDNDNLQFFEGYSFRIDSSRWKNIAHEAECVLMPADSISREFTPFDAPYYLLAYNSKMKSNMTELDQQRLSGFADYLRSNLLNQCMAKKPQWHWEK
jgi:hypothetical protein